MDTLVKKTHELGEFDGVDVALMIRKHSRYTTYISRDHASWPPSMEETVSKVISHSRYMTDANTILSRRIC